MEPTDEPENHSSGEVGAAELLSVRSAGEGGRHAEPPAGESGRRRLPCRSGREGHRGGPVWIDVVVAVLSHAQRGVCVDLSSLFVAQLLTNETKLNC